ncbi:hypothetical protein SETIT_9G423000v2 [Setaria italica]|uniref:Uncharacterized protein n=1 Tax=Setaria italica TaxID=4555 RepID=A0A368SRL4_SETIT|nr:hypothetical protein SETIT_9G423000v2 [Setaria italica]
MSWEWSVGLCSCFGDVGSCCLTCWCPCVTFGRVAAVVDRGSTSCCMNGTLYVLLLSIGCQWLYTCSNKVVGCVEGMRLPRKQSMCF